MEKNKLNYITYLVIFCVILSFVGCFFLGTYFGEKETVTKTEEKILMKKYLRVLK